MDNATAQPQDLDDDLPDGFDFVTVKFIPPNTTTLLQCNFPRQIFLRRQKQLTLDMFSVKKAWKATAEEEESTASKRQIREKTPKGELPSLFMDGNSPSKQ